MKFSFLFLAFVCIISAPASARAQAPNEDVRRLCHSVFRSFGYETELRCRRAANEKIVRTCVNAYRDLEGQLRCMEARSDDIVRLCIRAWRDWEGQLACMQGRSVEIIKRCVRSYPNDRKSQLACIRNEEE